MADNLGTPGGASGPVATDDIGGIHFQRIKLIHGADGVNAGDVSDANPLPIDDAGGSLTVDNAVLSVVGSGTEATAQRVTIATDSTGVLSVDDNGGSLTVDNAVLSVVGGGTEATAQRVTIASDSTGVLSVDDNGGSLTIDSTQLPASLGQKAMAASFAVTMASDQDSIPVTVSASKISVTKINGTTVGAQATPYSAGDLIGTKLTLTGVLGANETAVVSAVVLRTNGLTTNGGFALYLFDANPSSTTFTDGAAFDIDPADIEKVVAILGFPAANFYGGTSEKASLNAPNILMVSTVSGGTLYGAIVASASCEWGAINEGLAVTFTAETF